MQIESAHNSITAAAAGTRMLIASHKLPTCASRADFFCAHTQCHLRFGELRGSLAQFANGELGVCSSFALRISAPPGAACKLEFLSAAGITFRCCRWIISTPLCARAARVISGQVKLERLVPGAGCAASRSSTLQTAAFSIYILKFAVLWHCGASSAVSNLVARGENGC